MVRVYSDSQELAIAQVMSMGFNRIKAINALSGSGWNFELGLESLLRNPDAFKNSKPSVSLAVVPFDENLQKALVLSYCENPWNKIEKRGEGEDIGISACENDLFNCLLANLFWVSGFVECILKLEVADAKVVKELQRLFGYMLASNRKTVDSSDLLKLVGNGRVSSENEVSGFINQFFKTLDEVAQGEMLHDYFYGCKQEFCGNGELPAELPSFLCLKVDCDDRDIYSALHSKFSEGNRETWVKRFPKVLNFHIQRVKNNRKIFTAFHFPLVLYPDRFLIQNRGHTRELRRTHAEINEKIELLEKYIEKYERYGSTSNPLDALLQQTHEFLSAAVDHPENEEDLIQLTQELLMQYSQTARDQQVQMKQQLSSLKTQQEEHFNTPALQLTHYSLHSVTMHSGLSFSKGFYIYIKHATGWQKHLNEQVTPVTEEEVLSESIYCNGSNSCCVLTYLLDSLTTESSHMPNSLLCEVEEDNLLLEQQLCVSQNKELCKKIECLYIDRYTKIATYYNEALSSSAKTLQHSLINFHIHLKLKNRSIPMRWHLLNLCVKEVLGSPLADLDPVYAHLLAEFIIKGHETPPALVLTSSEARILDNESKHFQENCFSASILVYATSRVLDNDFTLALSALILHYKTLTNRSGYSLEVKRLFEAVLLRLTSEIMLHTYNNNKEQIVHFSWVLASLTSVYIPKTSLLHHILKQRLEQATSLYTHNNPGDSDFQVKSREILSSFETVVDLPTGILNTALSFPMTKDLEHWEEGWGFNSLARTYLHSSQSLTNAPFTSYLSLHSAISESRTVSTIDFYSAEKLSGIKPV